MWAVESLGTSTVSNNRHSGLSLQDTARCITLTSPLGSKPSSSSPWCVEEGLGGCTKVVVSSKPRERSLSGGMRSEKLERSGTERLGTSLAVDQRIHPARIVEKTLLWSFFAWERVIPFCSWLGVGATKEGECDSARGAFFHRVVVVGGGWISIVVRLSNRNTPSQWNRTSWVAGSSGSEAGRRNKERSRSRGLVALAMGKSSWRRLIGDPKK